MPLIYDEQKAISFIKSYVPVEIKNKLTDDDIDNIIGILYDYYEDSGLFEDNADDETIINIDEEKLISYVVNTIKQEKIINHFTSEEISFIIQGELAYCDSIGIFE